MDEELIILEVEETTETDVNTTDITQTIEQEENVEYIKVDEIEELEIEIEEGIGWVGGDATKHYSLDGRDDPDQHKICAITGLEDKLNTLSSAKNLYAIGSGFAEFQQWKGNGYYKTEEEYANTGGVGFFVSLVTEIGNTSGGNLRIDICKKINGDNTIEATDVYGVTVDNSGFCGNQDDKYNLLNSNSLNRAGDPNYAKVCLLGNVKVRVSAEEHKNINIGDYVVPNELGYAKKSENNVGFKVTSKGQIESVSNSTTAWYYVGIALVPQNDNVARVMEELEKSNGIIKDINEQLGAVAGEVDKIIDIGISEKFEDIDKNIENNKIAANQQFQVAQQAAQTAQSVANQAQAQASEAASKYDEATKAVGEAQAMVDDVLDDIKALQDDMSVLAQWPTDVKPGQSTGVAGFVAQANANNITLANLTKAFDENGADITAIIQKIDEQGAAIQHLVTHIDKYILGEYSPANGLTLEQTSFIQPGTIYVPTKKHTEKYKYKQGDEEKEFSFEFLDKAVDEEGNELGYGQSYIWKISEDPECEYMWKKDKPVSLSTEKQDGETEGDLWHCWQGVYSGDTIIYQPGTLYCWTKTESISIDKDTGTNVPKCVWSAVASANDGTASSVGLINQTAKQFTSVYTDLNEQTSFIKQTAQEISTEVSTVKGELSAINQTAKDIRLGVHNPTIGSSELELLLGGMSSTATYVGHVLVKTVFATPPTNVNKHSQPPMWNGENFVFSDGSISNYGEYYFESDDHKEYCKIINDGAGYEVYTIGNPSMANLHTRVTNTESEVESWTRFQKGQNETMTSINQTSDEEGASISSMVFGDFRQCVEIGEVEILEGDLDGSLIYSQQPKWIDSDSGGHFEFTDMTPLDIDKIKNGDVGYVGGAKRNRYEKWFFHDNNDDGVVDFMTFEIYQRKISPYSTIVQKVDDNGSSIGLVTGNDDKIGSLFVNTINDKSEVLINADKIKIHGTTTFADMLNPGTTTISGNYIKSGIVESNNYNGLVYKATDIKIENNKIVFDVGSGCFLYCYNINSLQGAHFKIIPFDENLIYPVLYNPTPSSPDEMYPYELSNWDDVVVFDEATQEFQWNAASNYLIVSEQPFDIIRIGADNNITGTRFNLDNGTICSKNLILDSNGNVDITGRITAISGYIGDSSNGFSINKNDTYYCLSNNQDSLDGGYTGYGGVYAAPDGIGLGNGRLIINRWGDMQLYKTHLNYISWNVHNENNVIAETLYGHSFGLGPGSDFIGLGNYSEIGEDGMGSYTTMWMYYMPNNTTTYTKGLYVDCQSYFNSKAYFNNGIKVSGGIDQSSDSRLKTNIENMNINATELLNQIELKSFDWIETNKHVNAGMIAQQLEQILPELVVTDETTDLKSINFVGLIPYLVKAIQELSAIINPPIMTLQLNDETIVDTYWVDDMTEEEKQYYVDLNKPRSLIYGVPRGEIVHGSIQKGEK